MEKLLHLIVKFGRYNVAEMLGISPATLNKRIENPKQLTVDNTEMIEKLYEEKINNN